MNSFFKRNTPSSQVHIGTFSRTDHILGHKSNLSKFKKTEIISSNISDNNAMRLDINYKENTVRNHKHIGIKQYVSK